MPHPKHALTELEKFYDAVRDGKTVQDMGFSDSVTRDDISRFATRYRVAKSFRGVLLEDFTQETIDGYTALFRLFLAWSAFEQLLELVGLQQRHEDTKKLFDTYDAPSLCQKLKSHDKDDTFFSFIQSQTNKVHHAEIEKHFKNQELNSSYLASAIRHIFAHGKLTPNANRSRPKKVVAMCDEITDFLLFIIDAEFSKGIS
jgi:hypothetical protein